jgi:hypothetical protein
MTITKVTDQNNEMYRQLLVNNLDKRHEALRIEEMRVREDIKANQAKRMELNRQLGRPGQNVEVLV